MHNPRHAPGRFNPTTAVANFVRGMLIGLAELVPGDLLLVLLVVSPCYFSSGAYWMMNGEQ